MRAAERPRKARPGMPPSLRSRDSRARAPRRGCRTAAARRLRAPRTTPPGPSHRALARARRERCAARLGGRQLGDRPDAEGVHEPRALPHAGVEVEALADALLGQQQRHVVGARGQRGPGSRRAVSIGISSRRRSSEVRGQHPGRPDREAVDRRQRLVGAPHAAEGRAEAGSGASRPPSRRSGRRSAAIGPAAAVGVKAGRARRRPEARPGGDGRERATTSQCSHGDMSACAGHRLKPAGGGPGRPTPTAQP